MDIDTVRLGNDGSYLVNGIMSVPPDPSNRYYQAVQDWIKEGNVPQAALPEPEREPDELEIRLTALETKAGITAADRDAARTEILGRQATAPTRP